MNIEKLKRFAVGKGFKIIYLDCNGKKVGYLFDKVIFLSAGMNEEDEIFVLAHELAHAYLHYGKGDTRKGLLHKAYEEQADRVANLILDLISMDKMLSVGRV